VIWEKPRKDKYKNIIHKLKFNFPHSQQPWYGNWFTRDLLSQHPVVTIDCVHVCISTFQDEEPPMTLAMQVYKGPANIPHAAGEFFAAFFLATNSALLAHMFPGKVFGSEIRPRKFE
jgi:hypothetical protein